MKKHRYLYLLVSFLALSSCSLVSGNSENQPENNETSSQQSTNNQTSEQVGESSQDAGGESQDTGESSQQAQGSSQQADHQHSWNDGEVTTPATCTQAGVRTFTCTSCQQTKTEVIPATGHTLEKVNAKEATYFETGNIEYWHCSACEKNFTDNTGTTEANNIVIPMLDHDDYYTITWKYDDGTVMDVEEVAFGTTPSYPTPTKAENKTYTYSFNGWSPAIAQVTANATYTASFTQNAKASTSKFPDTVYFTDGNGWGNVYVYAWGGTGGQNHAWPGLQMSFVKVNPHGQRVYSISGMSTRSNIIFTNGSSQTVDIGVSDLTHPVDNAFYVADYNGSKYTVGSWYESGVISTSYNFYNDGQNILHCLDWPLATIKNNLDKIADQGFNAIQISPIQPLKDYEDSYEDTNEVWWRFYQPIGLCIGNSTTNNLFATDNGKTELKELTKAAARKGIRIVADVIVNHLADTATGESDKHIALCPQVAEFCPDIYNNIQQTLHNPSGPASSDGSAYGITHADEFGKDLNTSNTIVQNYVKNFLKDLVDCGVTGFRFDAAKHIETKNESCGSNFWEKTLGAVCSYATEIYGRTIWSYAEIISPTDGGRSYYQYLNDAWMYAVTAEPGWHDISAQNCVSWGESHDGYFGNTSVTQSHANDEYARVAATNVRTNVLYLVRPILGNATAYIRGSTSVGADAANGWQHEFIRGVNGRCSYLHS